MNVLCICSCMQRISQASRVEIKTVRKRVVIVTSENASGHDRVVDQTDRTGCVFPDGGNAIVLAKSFPFAERAIVIDKNWYVGQFIFLNIVGQDLASFVGWNMVRLQSAPEHQTRGQLGNFLHSVQQEIRPAVLKHDFRRRFSQAVSTGQLAIAGRAGSATAEQQGKNKQRHSGGRAWFRNVDVGIQRGQLMRLRCVNRRSGWPLAAISLRCCATVVRHFCTGAKVSGKG